MGLGVRARSQGPERPAQYARQRSARKVKRILPLSGIV